MEVAILGGGSARQSGPIFQAFTRDISAGGLCVELKSFGREIEEGLTTPGTALNLSINPPFSLQPIEALASIAWVRKSENTTPVIYRIGLDYTKINPVLGRRIFGYAQRLIWAPRVAVFFGCILLAVSAYLFLSEQRLLHENKALVDQLIQSAEKKSDVTSKLIEIEQAKFKLSSDLDRAHRQIKSLNSKVDALQTQSGELRGKYKKELAAKLEIQKDLLERLKSIESGQARLEQSYTQMQKSEKITSSLALLQMYDWLKSHRNLKTGLVASFEGDASLENVSFTYDLSLACQTFLLFGDTQDAEKILSFYNTRAQTQDGAFVNAYSSLDGEPIESMVHTGPNVWVGIAALQYESRLKDGKFIPLARRLGDWLISFQDEEGGFKGGPQFSWYSTEHNLDAYAFFGMLYEVTRDTRYKDAQSKVFSWIRKYAYSMAERRMNRGKGDATIATDTFSWAVAAIGPEKLKEFDFDPEAIMEFIEEHCKVTVPYKQPGGNSATATGFDFARAQNLGRGGIISCEWTAQVIVTYQILSRYYVEQGDHEKADFYQNKAVYYLSELQKLIITSPSKIGKGRGCLPYASVDNAETGHGWRTPKGIRTGSVSGTAYGIFAWTGFNPFDLKSHVNVKNPVESSSSRVE